MEPNLPTPDLVFFYSLSDERTTINKTIQGSDIIQTASGIIFADSELLIPIGKFAFNVTIFDTIKDNIENLYGVTGTNVYFLPEGTLSNSINIEFLKDNKGNFIIPPAQINAYQILSGSGDFLNQKGIIVQASLNIPDLAIRKMFVFFDK